jgi:hypothetical protein
MTSSNRAALDTALLYQFLDYPRGISKCPKESKFDVAAYMQGENDTHELADMLHDTLVEV